MSELLLDTLQQIKQQLDESGENNLPYRFLFLGYTDIHAADAWYVSHFGEDAVEKLENRENFEKLREIHGRGSDVSKVPTLRSLVSLMFGDDVVFDVIDFQTYEGSEMIVDLNLPVADEHHDRYDLVIDNGTTEHVFDYAQALRNCARMCRRRGYVFHAVPMNWPNHGFYNLSPTLFHDFYEDNGFKTVSCTGKAKALVNGVEQQLNIDLPPTERFNFSQINGIEVNLHYLVKKLETVEDFTNPVQHKYRDASAWI